jgi:3-hydroxymyristoyl/3-hydroxydecanoyl-(acyl carrier protein) dehydratase
MEWYELFEKGEISDKDTIAELIPHRHEMSFLNRISYIEELDSLLGEVLIESDAFWTRGHFPVPETQNSDKFKIGPIFPGVLMIESAAQLGICNWRKQLGLEETAKKTMLLKQVDNVKYFRDVRPGDTLFIKTNSEKSSMRLMKSFFEGVVFKKESGQAEKCFECTIAGLSV